MSVQIEPQVQVERLEFAIKEMIAAAETMQRENMANAKGCGSARSQMKNRAVATRCGMLLGEMRKIARAALGEKE